MTGDLTKTTMTVREARRELEALPYRHLDRTAYWALLEAARRDPDRSQGPVRIFLRGWGATDANIERMTTAFYVLAAAPDDE